MTNRFAVSFLGAVIAIAAAACSFSTANISSFKTGKDKAMSQPSTVFKGGDPFFAQAVVSNSGSKVTVKFYMVVEDAPGFKKGDLLPGSEVKVDLPSSGTANFNGKFPTEWTGKFSLVAEMLNESGEKKDSKSVILTVESAAADAASDEPAEKSAVGKKTSNKDGGTPDDKSGDKEGSKEGSKVKEGGK